MKPWLDRKFGFEGLDGTYLPILERLEGTPGRLSNKLNQLTREQITMPDDNKWSIAEHAGHLLTMESLWIARLDDLVLKHEELRAWNGNNADTDAAEFNRQNPKTVLADFTTTRSAIVNMMRNLAGKEEVMWALHPRLKSRVRLLDHAWFMAEHDDHHLAAIQKIIEKNFRK